MATTVLAKRPKSVVERLDSDQDPKVVRATADMLKRRGMYERAIKVYSKAMEIKEDIRCLVSRSQCHLKLGEVTKALTDADIALAADKTDYKAILCKAEALFHRSEFELALVFFHRGRKLRSDIQDFDVGIQKCEDAINNAVGSPAIVKLTTAGDLTGFYDEERLVSKSPMLRDTLKRAKKRLIGNEVEKKAINKDPVHRRTVHELLGQIFNDKDYLEQLLEATETSTESGKNICNLANDSLTYLEKCSDFWRAHRPMYSRAHDKQAFKAKYTKAVVYSVSSDILTKLERIDKAHTEGKYRRVLTSAYQCLLSLKKYPLEHFGNKHAIRAQLHACLGNAHLELKQFTEALKHHEEDFKISKKNNIPDGISRSMDNIGLVHFRCGEHTKAIGVWEAKLPMVHSTEEGLWLTQQLCRSYLALNRPLDALFYARTSVDAVDVDIDPLWALHGHVLSAQCNSAAKQWMGAVTSYEEALAVATSIGDKAAMGTLRDILGKVRTQMRKSEEKGNITSLSAPHVPHAPLSPHGPRGPQGTRSSSRSFGAESTSESVSKASRNTRPCVSIDVPNIPGTVPDISRKKMAPR